MNVLGKCATFNNIYSIFNYVSRCFRFNMKVYLDIASIIVDGHSFHDQPHQWCNGWRDLNECGRSWARAPVGSNIRL